MSEFFKAVLNIGGVIREVFNVLGKMIKDLNTKAANSFFDIQQDLSDVNRD